MANTKTQRNKGDSSQVIDEITLNKYRERRRTKEKEIRQLRRIERQQNRTSERRLAFLHNVFYTKGYNAKQIAQLTGSTQQALSWHFAVKDDCRLSQAQRWLDAIGLTLKVEMKKVRQEELQQVTQVGVSNNVRSSIKGNFAQELKKVNITMPDYVNECKPTDRIYFLAQYLPTVGLPITEMMQKCGVDLSSLRYMFVNDDIKISRIYQIAEKTGAEIVWHINKKADATGPEPAGKAPKKK